RKLTAISTICHLRSSRVPNSRVAAVVLRARQTSWRYCSKDRPLNLQRLEEINARRAVSLSLGAAAPSAHYPTVTPRTMRLSIQIIHQSELAGIDNNEAACSTCSAQCFNVRASRKPRTVPYRSLTILL